MKTRTISFIAFLVAFLWLTLGASFSFAQNNSFKDLFSPEQSGDMGVLDILTNLTRVVRIVFLPIMTLAVFWAGYTMATAKGSETQYTAGKKILFQAFVGTAIIVAAELLVQIAREFQRQL